MPRFWPMVTARRALEPAGRWDEFLAAYRELTARWDTGIDDEAALPAAYLLVTGTRRRSPEGRGRPSGVAAGIRPRDDLGDERVCRRLRSEVAPGGRVGNRARPPGR